jgi:hypothetical protein
MKPALPMILAAALAGAVAGGLVVALVPGGGDGDGGTSPSEATRVQRLSTQVDVLQDGIDDLQRQVRQLELAMLTMPPEEEAATPLTPPPAPRVDGTEAALAALAGDDAQVEEVLKARVADVVADLRAAEEQARDERREEMRQQMLEDRLTQLTEQLGLDTYQAGRMRETLTDADTKRGELFRSAREEGGWGTLRTGMEELRTSTRQDLETFLTPSQLESWDAMPQMGFGGRRGGFGGPGGPGPGGAGPDGPGPGG